jgi:glutamate-1-semialdehyde 2,1-aminomutase
VKQIIPLASQTFSKAYNRWPEGPRFLSHGKGGRVWDIDGNEYVDMVAGLLPIVLGYRDKDVDGAIQAQLCKGISFSLPTLLEADLADRLIEFIPSAEMCRFGKSGTDATSAAVRLARAVTGRDHIISCGYHGWQDWSIGRADNVENRVGVPPVVRTMTTQIRPEQPILWNNFPPIAAIIVDCSKIDKTYAEYLRSEADKLGALLIFDEVITGFRWDIGGAQTVWGIKPDLSCFSKAMGNGMPISAIVGRADLMKNFDHVFFSGTFGGETLSIAASIACIDKIEREDVCEHLAMSGRMLKAEFGESDQVWLTGHPAFQQLNFASPEVRERYITAMLEHEVLVNTSLNVCHAHTVADLYQVIDAHYMALQRIEKLAA